VTQTGRRVEYGGGTALALIGGDHVGARVFNVAHLLLWAPRTILGYGLFFPLAALRYYGASVLCRYLHRLPQKPTLFLLGGVGLLMGPSASDAPANLCLPLLQLWMALSQMSITFSAQLPRIPVTIPEMSIANRTASECKICCVHVLSFVDMYDCVHENQVILSYFVSFFLICAILHPTALSLQGWVIISLLCAPFLPICTNVHIRNYHCFICLLYH